MNELFAQLNDFSFNVLLLLATILIKALLSRYIQTEPLRFFSWYNQLLAKKLISHKIVLNSKILQEL